MSSSLSASMEMGALAAGLGSAAAQEEDEEAEGGGGVASEGADLTHPHPTSLNEHTCLHGSRSSPTLMAQQQQLQHRGGVPQVGGGPFASPLNPGGGPFASHPQIEGGPFASPPPDTNNMGSSQSLAHHGPAMGPGGCGSMGGAGSPWGAPDVVAAVTAAAGNLPPAPSGGLPAGRPAGPLGKPPLPQPLSRRTTQEDARGGTPEPGGWDAAGTAGSSQQQQQQLQQHAQPQPGPFAPQSQQQQPERSSSPQVCHPDPAHRVPDPQQLQPPSAGGSGSLAVAAPTCCATAQLNATAQPRHYQKGRFDVVEEGAPVPPTNPLLTSLMHQASASLLQQGSGGSAGGGTWAPGPLSPCPSVTAATAPAPGGTTAPAPAAPIENPQGAGLLQGQPLSSPAPPAALGTQLQAGPPQGPLQGQGSGSQARLPSQASLPGGAGSGVLQGRSSSEVRLGRFTVRMDDAAEPTTAVPAAQAMTPPATQLDGVAVAGAADNNGRAASANGGVAAGGAVATAAGGGRAVTWAAAAPAAPEPQQPQRSFTRVQSRGRFTVTEAVTTPPDVGSAGGPMSVSPPSALEPVQEGERGGATARVNAGTAAAVAHAAAAQQARQRFHEDVVSMLRSAAAAQHAGEWARGGDVGAGNGDDGDAAENEDESEGQEEGGQQVEVMVGGGGRGVANGLIVNVQLGDQTVQNIQLEFGGMEGLQGPGAEDAESQGDDDGMEHSSGSSMHDTDVLLHHIG